MKFNMAHLLALLLNSRPTCSNALPSAGERWPPINMFEDINAKAAPGDRTKCAQCDVEFVRYDWGLNDQGR